MSYFERHRPSSVVIATQLAAAAVIGGPKFFIIFALGTGAAWLAVQLDHYGVPSGWSSTLAASVASPPAPRPGHTPGRAAFRTDDSPLVRQPRRRVRFRRQRTPGGVMEASSTPPEDPRVHEGVDPNAEPQSQESPDEGAGPAVEPLAGAQGPQVAEQDPATATATAGPSEGVRQSAPPPEAQSGVPAIPENADVEPQPQYAGPVGDSGQAAEGTHAEANETPAAAPPEPQS